MSDKGSRRAHVAARYRILLVAGDDFNDFLSGVRVGMDKRLVLAEPYQSWWGVKWIILPNPSYGTWEDAVFNGPRPASASERLRVQRERLTP